MLHPLKGLRVLALTICVLPAIAIAGTQQITPSSNNITAAPGESFELTLNYSADSETLTGVGVQLYYNSSKLQLTGVTGIYQSGKLAVESVSKTDTKNGDGDASTDRFINAAWFDLGGRWPGANATPLPLYTVRFTVIESSGPSAINLTGKPAGGQNLTLGSVTFSGTGGTAGGNTGSGGDQPDSGGDTGSSGNNGNGGSDAGTGSDGGNGDTGTDTNDGTTGSDGNGDSNGNNGTDNSNDTNGDANGSTDPSASAKSQRLSISSSQPELSAGESVIISVKYAADSPTLTGVGVQLHFDSSKLKLDEITSVYAAGKLAVDSQASPDESNLDNDSLTDQKLNAAWFDLGSGWPGASVAQPLTLYTAKFTAKDFIGNTGINLSGRAASGQNLSLGSLTVTGKQASDTGSGAGNPGNNDSNTSDNNGTDNSNTDSNSSNTGGDASNGDGTDSGNNTGTDAGSTTNDPVVQGDSGSQETTSKKKRGLGSISWMTLLFFGLIGWFGRVYFFNTTRTSSADTTT